MDSIEVEDRVTFRMGRVPGDGADVWVWTCNVADPDGSPAFDGIGDSPLHAAVACLAGMAVYIDENVQ